MPRRPGSSIHSPVGCHVGGGCRPYGRRSVARERDVRSPVHGYGFLVPALRYPRLTVTGQRRTDAALAVALAVIGQALLWTGAVDEGPVGVTGPCYLLMALAVGVRRQHPVLMTGTVATAWVAQSVLAISPTSLWALVLILVVAFSAGAYAADRTGYACGGVLIAATYAGAWLEPHGQLGDRLFTAPVLCGGPWLAGWLVRRHRLQAYTLAEVNVELERRRADDVRAATAEERSRIARELHDVVAHGISVMVVQAGAAAKVLDRDPEQARQPLEQIRSTGKAALNEMRHLLDVLRTDQPPGLAPLPGLADLSDLAARMRQAGVLADLDLPDPLPSLSPGCGLAAYRIVQEALTNTLKHAGKVPAWVQISYEGGALLIHIRDAGRKARTNDLRVDERPGHGLIGMRERARVYGGTVDAGPCEGGGWTVTARLPLDVAVDA